MEFGGTEPPEYEITFEPGIAVRLPPMQLVETLGVGATVSPAGRLSVNEILELVAKIEVLSITNLNVETCPAGTMEGVKLFENTGGCNLMV